MPKQGSVKTVCVANTSHLSRPLQLHMYKRRGLHQSLLKTVRYSRSYIKHPSTFWTPEPVHWVNSSWCFGAVQLDFLQSRWFYLYVHSWQYLSVSYHFLHGD